MLDDIDRAQNIATKKQKKIVNQNSVKQVAHGLVSCSQTDKDTPT